MHCALWLRYERRVDTLQCIRLIRSSSGVAWLAADYYRAAANVSEHYGVYHNNQPAISHTSHTDTPVVLFAHTHGVSMYPPG